MPLSSLLPAIIVAALATLASLYIGHIQSCSSCPLTVASVHTGYFDYECANKPHQSSWSSWWHPQRRSASSTNKYSDRMGGAGTTTRDWNILYHLGGNGPWVERVDGVVEGGVAVPGGCEVVMAHMMSRHAERYPTKKAANGQRAVVKRMKESGIEFTGSLSFFNEWELFWEDDRNLEQLTRTGPFSGTLGSFTTGVRLRTRYKHLLDQALSHSPPRPVRYWASDSQRVIDTARYFAQGFFGIDHVAQNISALQIISEHHDVAADTLTPGRTCLNNRKDKLEGQQKGYRLLGEYQATYLHAIRERLYQQTGILFSDQDVYAMQEMCGFETTVRGYSDWCDVFTQDEILAFEYARDILHYYRAGPGQKYAAAMGWLWLNATTNLLLEGPEAGPLFFSFVHDGDIAPMITALDIINDASHLPTTHIVHNRKWRKSQIAPMGGRVIFELLSCKTPASNTSAPEKFVRLNINDGITAIPGCDGGPGRSCPLEDFAERTRKRGVEVGGFRELCGIWEGGAERITFLHQ